MKASIISPGPSGCRPQNYRSGPDFGHGQCQTAAAGDCVVEPVELAADPRIADPAAATAGRVLGRAR